VAGQLKAKRALTKEQQLRCENKQLKGEQYIPKKLPRFVAEEHQADIQSSMLRASIKVLTLLGFFAVSKMGDYVLRIQQPGTRAI